MAQQPQFNVQFQGFTQSQGFDPLKVPDPNPYLQQHLQAMSSSFTNLAQSGKLSYADEAENLGKAAELAAFVPKFMQYVAPVDKLLDIEARKAVINQVEQKQREQAEQVKIETGTVTETGNQIETNLVNNAQQLQSAGAPLEMWDTIIKANKGKRRRQAEILMAERMFKGENSLYRQWQNDQFQNNDGIIKLPSGTYQINNPNLHPTVRDQIRGVLYNKFLEHPVFSHIAPEIISNASQTFRVAADDADATRYRKQFRINQGEINAQDAITSYRVAFDDNTGQVNLGQVLDTSARKYAMQPATNGLGNRGFDKFWDALTKDAESAGLSGLDYDFDKLKRAVLPNGKTAGDVIVDGKLVRGFYGDKIATMQMAYLKAKNQRFTITESSKKRSAIEANQALIKTIELEGDNLTEAGAMNILKQGYKNLQGTTLGSREGMLDELSRAIMTYTPDGKRSQALLDEALELNFRQQLGTDHGFFKTEFGRAYVPPGASETLYAQAKRRDELMNSPEKKDALKQFNLFVAGDTNTELTAFDELKGRVGNVAAEFKARGNAVYASSLLKNGGNHLLAAQDMYTYLEESWKRDTKMGSGHKLYDRGKNGQFDAFHEAKKKQLTDGVNFDEYSQPLVNAAHGKDIDNPRMGLFSAIQSKPGLVGTQEELLKFYSEYQRNGYVPPKIIAAVDRINSNSPTKIVGKHMDIVVAGLKAYNPSFDPKAYVEMSKQEESLSATDRKIIDCINKGTYCNIKGRMFNYNAASNVRDGFPPPVMSTISGPSTYTTKFNAFKNGDSLYSYARNELGLSEVHALGLMINAIRESSIRTSNPGDNGTSDGIFQWHAGRLQRARKALGDQWDDPRAQLKYALEEKGEPGQEYLKQKFTSVQEAADWWMRRWERTADPENDSRKHTKFIQQYLTPAGS